MDNTQLAWEILWGAITVVVAIGGSFWVFQLFTQSIPGVAKKKLLAAAAESKKGAEKRVESLLVSSAQLNMVWAIVGLLGVIGIVLLLPAVAEIKGIGIILTFVMGLGLSQNGLQSFKKNREKGYRLAIQEAIDRGEEGVVEALVLGGWETQNTKVRLHAVEGAMQAASPGAISFLMKTVQRAGSEGNRLMMLGINKDQQITFAELKKGDITAIENLKNLVEQNFFWRWFAFSIQESPGKVPVDIESKLLKAQLVEAFLHQASLVAAHPHTYCLRDFARGVLKSTDEWHYVVSPISGDYRQMKAGIHTVIGNIGPIEEAETESGTLRLPLWDAANNKAIPMELDAIAIVGGADFNYDWAVSASIEALRNRFPEKELKLDVTFDSSLALSANTRALLGEVSNRA